MPKKPQLFQVQLCEPIASINHQKCVWAGLQIIQAPAFEGTQLTLDEAEKNYLNQALPKLQIYELNRHVCLKPLGLWVLDNIINNQNTTPSPETCVIVELSVPFPTVAETIPYVHQTISLPIE